MKRLAYALGAVALLAVVAALALPAFVDTPAVRAEIQRRIAQAVDGEISWEALKIGFFPAPHGELRRVRIEMPGRMSLAADRVQAYLRLWPLLRGRAEIASFTVSRPELRIHGSEESEKQELDAVAAYRKAIEPVVRALQRFAPDTVLRIESAAVNVADLRDLNASLKTGADGMDLELSAASAFWKRLSIKGRVEYASLAARAQVELDALVLDKDLPPVQVRAQLRTDARTAIENDFDATLGPVAAAKGKVVFPAGKPPELAARVDAGDLAQALALARLKVPGLDVIESAEGRLSADVAVSLAPEWQAQIEITKSSAAVKLAQLPWKLSAHAARVTVTPEQVHVAGARGLVGNSTFENVAALIDLGKTPGLTAASGRATVRVEQWLPWLKTKVPLEEIASASGNLEVTLNRLALRFDRPAEVEFDAVATPRKFTAKLTALPEPVRLAGGTIHADAKRVRVAGLAGAIGDSTFDAVAVQIDLGKTPRLAAASGRATVRVEQWLPWLQTKLPLEQVASASGSIEVALNRLALRFDRPAEVDFDAVATPRKFIAKLTALPEPVRLAGGTIHADAKRVRGAGLAGAIGDSTFDAVAVQIDLGKTPGVSAASGRATIKLDPWLPWLQGQLLLHDVAALSGSIDVTLNRMALRFDRPAEVEYEADATLRQVSMTLKGLPGPLGIASGSMRFGRDSARYEKLAVAMLDARALLSGGATLEGPRFEFALEQGTVGEKAVRWALELASVPPRFEPRTPLRFAARRIAWAPEEGLEADARIDFDGGPALGVVLASKPDLLDLRRVTIKDARSDAVLGATIAADQIKASFSGTLHGHSIPRMLRQPLPADSGTAQGELRLTIDRKRPERTLAEGKLRIEALDLSWLAGRKALIERAELIAEGAGGRITGARFGVEDQFFELSGEGRRTDQGPVIEARIESAGVMLERLLPPPDPNAPKKKSSAIWPLPVTGRVEVAAGFIQHKDYRIEPFEGVLSLEPKRARLDVKEARMCGVSFPMEVEAEPESTRAAAHITIKNQPLERTLHCLTGGDLQITGSADLRAELRIEGRRPHLVRGLTGTVEAEVRQGRVKKFALLGSILSFRGIASLREMNEAGFPYRRMTAKGSFANGAFLVDESFFDSDAVRLAATGRVDLLGANSQLTVLVGLLTRVDRIAGAIPIIGDIFGGSMTALPIAVRGDIRDPVIVPLGPRAVTDQLLGIFERTLRLPGKLVPAPNSGTEP